MNRKFIQNMYRCVSKDDIERFMIKFYPKLSIEKIYERMIPHLPVTVGKEGIIPIMKKSRLVYIEKKKKKCKEILK